MENEMCVKPAPKLPDSLPPLLLLRSVRQIHEADRYYNIGTATNIQRCHTTSAD